MSTEPHTPQARTTSPAESLATVGYAMFAFAVPGDLNAIESMTQFVDHLQNEAAQATQVDPTPAEQHEPYAVQDALAAYPASEPTYTPEQWADYQTGMQQTAANYATDEEAGERGVPAPPGTCVTRDGSLSTLNADVAAADGEGSTANTRHDPEEERIQALLDEVAFLDA